MHKHPDCVHQRSVIQQTTIDQSRNTDLEATLILLCLFSNNLLVFCKDGWHALEPLDCLCVELHVQWCESGKVHQETQLCVGVCHSLLQQRHLCGHHLIHVGLDGGTGQKQKLV